MSYLGNVVPPFYTNWGYAGATTPGILNPSANPQIIGGNKSWINQAADKGTLATWTPAAYLACPSPNTDINFNLSHIVQFATGNFSPQYAFRIQAPTYDAVGATTIAHAVTHHIDRGPQQTGNATITYSWAFALGTPINTANSAAAASTSQGIFASSTNVAQTLYRNASVGLQVAVASGAAFFGTETAHPLNVQVGNTVRAIFDTSGRLLFGTSGAWSVPAATTQGALYNDTSGGILTLAAVSAAGSTKIDLVTTNAGTVNANCFRLDENAAVTHTAKARTGVSETLYAWKMADDATAKLEVANTTTTDNVFAAWLKGTSNSSNPGLFISGAVNSDSSNATYCLSFDARTAGNGSITTRNLFGWFNNSSLVMKMDKDASLTTTGGRVRKVRVALTSPVTVATTDDIVQIKLTTPGAVAVSLPASPEAGREYTLQDATGDAGANNITVTPNAGNINGAGTLVMNVNYQRKVLQYDSSATAQWLAG